ncbi:Rz1-like lysis system protein LysC [Avibacterium paragallinarum]|uniref:Rz1-like lysis system protein LysC n=1 Tax=Avibacterium paragallinarum TaxID=728 RepID=UPI001C98ECB2|nr:Rz1-like lysis system protein LysC [Avibacterium paragallinarum]QZP16339.1 Rz1-like lysis system protein LysC [Avibacterium paragallinarum]
MMLFGCSTQPINTAQVIICPIVASCDRPTLAIKTNGDLATALIDYQHNLSQCQLANRTLKQCISDYNQFYNNKKPKEKHNEK